MVRLTWTVVLVVCTLAGCGPSGADQAGDVPADTVTQAERDSAVARSGLPGASAVGRALDVSETAKERAAQLDSIR